MVTQQGIRFEDTLSHYRRNLAGGYATLGQTGSFNPVFLFSVHRREQFIDHRDSCGTHQDHEDRRKYEQNEGENQFYRRFCGFFLG